MQSSPYQIITDTLDVSINALKPVVEAMKAAANTARHQLLLPDSEQGLQEGLFAYTLFLTENTLSGHNRTIKQLLADYNNEWTFLFDAVRDGDKTLAPLVHAARTAQKAAHARLVAILDTGNGDGRTEYAALTAALTALMGENAESAAARSRKGIKHEMTRIPAEKAAEWADVSVSTIRRYWRHPIKSLPRPPLNEVNAPQEAMEDWGLVYNFVKVNKTEANRKNHAINFSDLPEKVRRRFGLT